MEVEVGHIPTIHAAARAGDLEALNFHLRSVRKLDLADQTERNLDFNLDRTGRNPLHWAAERGQKEAVELLINAGADPNAVWSPENVASYVRNPVLRQRYGLPSLRPSNPNDKTPYDLAQQGGHTEVMELLKAHGGKSAKSED